MIDKTQGVRSHHSHKEKQLKPPQSHSSIFNSLLTCASRSVSVAARKAIEK